MPSIISKGVISIKDAEKTRDEAKEIPSCASCSTKIKVTNVSFFAAGQHISRPGTYSVFDSYRHHAIVKEVKGVFGTSVKLELIEFSKKGFSKKIYMTETTFDLKYDDIFVIVYKHQRYTNEEVVKRAESMLSENTEDSCKFGNYNPVFKNCEHFATWCVLDGEQSLQVQNFLGGIPNKFNVLLQPCTYVWKNAKTLRSVFNISPQKIAGALIKCSGGIDQGTILVGTAALYLQRYAVVTCIHLYLYMKNRICLRCIKRKQWDMLMELFTFCITSVAPHFIIKIALSFVSPTFGVLAILIPLALKCSASMVRKKLKSQFQGHQIYQKKIKVLSEIDAGDAVSMEYWGLSHGMIVTEVKGNNDTEGKIKCIHYGLPTWNIFGTRIILEEWFPVDLKKQKVSKYDFQNVEAYDKEVAINRARKRDGETKWRICSNRSEDFCYWVKFHQLQGEDCHECNIDWEAKTGLKTLQLDCIVEKEIHMFNEFQPGDAIKFAEWGILVRKTSLDDGYGRRFEIEMIFHTFFSVVQRKTYEIDLNKHTLMVKKYHPAPCLPMEERVQRAKIAEKNSLRFLSTTTFLKFCILFPTTISL